MLVPPSLFLGWFLDSVFIFNSTWAELDPFF